MTHNLYIAFMGIVIIFFILVALAIAVSVLTKKQNSPKAPKSVPQPSNTSAIPNETIAVISAAVYTALGNNVRIKSIIPTFIPGENNAWRAQAKHDAINRTPQKQRHS